MTVSASILANSPSGDNCVGLEITSQGSNISDDASCKLAAAGDLPDTEPLLGPLQDNGGLTLTHLPQPGSPAIDAAACLTSADQRAISRPQGSACDIGSVELRFTTTHPLCANRYTGAVTSVFGGSCGAQLVPLLDLSSAIFCIDRYTGRLLYSFGRPCAAPRIEHRLIDDGALLTCLSRYTGAHRWVPSHSRCTATELPNTIGPQ